MGAKSFKEAMWKAETFGDMEKAIKENLTRNEGLALKRALDTVIEHGCGTMRDKALARELGYIFK